jgi:3-oxoacyl-[acyl-carrier-protein] synthase II
MKEKVVVTGYGLVSPIGMNAEDFEKNLFAGTSGVKSLRGKMVSSDFPVPYAAWIDRESLPKSKLYQNPSTTLKSWLMTEAATRQALDDLDPKLNIDAVVYGTADGASYEIVEEVLKNDLLNNSYKRPPFDYNTVCSQSSLETLRDVAKSLGFSNINDRNLISLNGACASGNQTIGLAFEGLRSGRWKRCVVGGVDARCEPSNYLNFYLLGALTTAEIEPEKASRPFSKDRSGFVRGEGAAVLVLETLTEAKARGAKILGFVSGYGCTSDAYRLTDGREDVASVKHAIQQALQTAELSPKDIDYINAHGTSTPLNDRLETTAIKSVFTDRAKSIPISSIKSQIGHSTIASSAIEAIACLIMLKNQMASATINCEVPDPECDLDYIPEGSRHVKMTHILSNSFGFGGQNSCVVFSAYGEAD